MKFQWAISDFSPKYFGGGGCSIWAKPLPKWQLARKIQRAQVSQISVGTCSYALPCTLDGSCSHFCFILHPHRVAVPVPPTFASLRPWRNTFVQIYGEQLCSRQNLGPPHRNKPKMTKIWGWGHLIVQIHPPPGSYRFCMKLVLVKQGIFWFFQNHKIPGKSFQPWNSKPFKINSAIHLMDGTAFRWWMALRSMLSGCCQWRVWQMHVDCRSTHNVITLESAICWCQDGCQHGSDSIFHTNQRSQVRVLRHRWKIAVAGG